MYLPRFYILLFDLHYIKAYCTLQPCSSLFSRVGECTIQIDLYPPAHYAVSSIVRGFLRALFSSITRPLFYFRSLPTCGNTNVFFSEKVEMLPLLLYLNRAHALTSGYALYVCCSLSLICLLFAIVDYYILPKCFLCLALTRTKLLVVSLSLVNPFSRV